ncbi:MAG: T9SS type A sorting domain-containing protein [Chryseolinea sp.]
MKRPIYKQLIRLMSLAMLVFIQLSFTARTNEPQATWYGNDHFKIRQEQDVVTVNMSKMPWESFATDVRQLELAEGFLSFDVKSDRPFTLRVDGLTVNDEQIELLTQEIGAGDFQQVIQHLQSNSSKINHLIFYVNPGHEFFGEVKIKGLGISTYTDDSKVTVFPNPSSGDVIVQLPNREFTQLVLFDESGNEVLRESPAGARRVKLNLEGKKQGLYVLRAISKGDVQTTKVIIK